MFGEIWSFEGKNTEYIEYIVICSAAKNRKHIL